MLFPPVIKVKPVKTYFIGGLGNLDNERPDFLVKITLAHA
jgi:hypothetical protein